MRNFATCHFGICSYLYPVANYWQTGVSMPGWQSGSCVYQGEELFGAFARDFEKELLHFVRKSGIFMYKKQKRFTAGKRWKRVWHSRNIISVMLRSFLVYLR